MAKLQSCVIIWALTVRTGNKHGGTACYLKKKHDSNMD